MKLTLACRDIGLDCDYVSHGEFYFELTADAAVHFQEAHGYTEEQVDSPETIEKIKAAVKQSQNSKYPRKAFFPH